MKAGLKTGSLQSLKWATSGKTHYIEKVQSPYLPPRPSIRSLSLGSSGLWSCVTSTALMNGSEGSSWIPRTTAESPTCATYMRFPRITTTLAVVPDVLGRPVSVFGHSAEKMKDRQIYLLSFKHLLLINFLIWTPLKYTEQHIWQQSKLSGRRNMVRKMILCLSIANLLYRWFDMNWNQHCGLKVSLLDPVWPGGGLPSVIRSNMLLTHSHTQCLWNTQQLENSWLVQTRPGWHLNRLLLRVRHSTPWLLH